MFFVEEQTDHYSYFAYFLARNRDEYKAELQAATEEEAIREAWDAFMDTLREIRLEHLATGEVVKYLDIYEGSAR